jgi:toxin-antitoxin system PIN domain toxin
VTVLLDASVLIALVTEGHVHHETAELWFQALGDHHATCPVTQGALIRMALREGAPALKALESLASVTSHPLHDFWTDELGYDEVDLRGVIGHRQVTDAYLASLARHRGGQLATFDQGLAALHPDVGVLVPTAT